MNDEERIPKLMVWLLIAAGIVIILIGNFALGADDLNQFSASAHVREAAPRPAGAIKPDAPLAPEMRVILQALAEIESNDNPSAVGRAGERGRHQLSAAAWEHSGRLLGCWCGRGSHKKRLAAFGLLSRTAHNEAHAAAYYHYLQSRLAAALKRNPTPAEIFAAWNTGPSRFERRGLQLRRCPAVTRDAGARFSRLLESIQGRAGGNLARQ